MAAFWARYRKRLSVLVLIVGAVVVGRIVSDAAPREVDLAYDLGPEHATFTEVRVAYSFQGEEVAAVRFADEDGLPQTLDHRVELSPGRYAIVAEMAGPLGRMWIERALIVPADGIVHVELFDTAMASLGRLEEVRPS